eukprot:scaffold19676_cov95-Skeletonema_dohrnii-CCMP3373.AAC.2
MAAQQQQCLDVPVSNSERSKAIETCSFDRSLVRNTKLALLSKDSILVTTLTFQEVLKWTTTTGYA